MTMATKGTTTIEMEMFAALEGLVADTVRGTFYPSGLRPTDAVSEDAVLTCSNATAGQIQEGRARLNIYVPDIDNGGGNLVADKERLMELEAVDGAVVEKLNEAYTDYRFGLFQATEAMAVPGRDEHLVSIGIRFRLITFTD